MKEDNRRFTIKKFVIVIFIVVALWFFLFPLQGLDTLYLYKTLLLGKWVDYKNSASGLSLQYPQNPFIRGDGFITTSKGWTTIANCDPSGILIVGDKNQVFSISICTKPSNLEVENILNDERYKSKNTMINGRSYIEISTEEELERSLKGRYLISNNHDLLIGIGKPPLSDDTRWFNQAMDKIFLKIISSIKKS